MFLYLMQLIVLFFFGVLILTPTYIRLMKHNMYNEWKVMWEKEIEREKRRLVNAGVKKQG